MIVLKYLAMKKLGINDGFLFVIQTSLRDVIPFTVSSFNEKKGSVTFYQKKN